MGIEKNKIISVLAIIISGIILVTILGILTTTDQSDTPVYAEPYVNDPNFIVEEFVSGLKQPTTMAFVGDDILVLEKKVGDVRLVRDGILKKEPVLHVDVNPGMESGLLGITTKDSSVYLYFTAAEEQGGEAIGNHIYKYTWNGEKLIDGILVKDLPVYDQAPNHNGGAMETGLDGTIFAMVGNKKMSEALQNVQDGIITDTGVIMIVNKDESVLTPSATENPTEHYYSMGIRNGFGLAIDPITGYLWDTENGPRCCDEINLVPPKFNSGWELIQGPATEEQIKSIPKFYDFEYSDPEFTWEISPAPTGLTFVTSDAFREYQNFLLVGAYNAGTIYKFELNSDRTGFSFVTPELQDLVLHLADRFDETIFSAGFTHITDLEFGPDGFLYIIDYKGEIYRVVPNEISTSGIVIPKWLKNNAGWWAEEAISDDEFTAGIQFLIANKFMIIPETVASSSISLNIPSWVKNNAGEWSRGHIDDLDFVSGIQHLIANGVIHISKDKINCDATPGIGKDFSGCDLSGNNLSGLDISYSKMRDTILVNSNLETTKMTSADFSGSNLEKAKLSGAFLQGANFEGANLRYADLENTDFSRAILRNSDLSGANLFKGNFLGVDLKNSNMTQIKANNVVLSHSILNNVDLSNSELKGASFLKSTFKNAILTGSNLQDANLESAFLENSNFVNADLSGAFLEKANFSDADLTGAILDNIIGKFLNFDNVDLTRTSFKNTDLTKPHFKGAILNYADLSGVTFEEANFSNANLSNADLTGANLKGANFSNANLSNADLTGANLKGANLKGANLKGAVLSNTNFTDAIMDGCIECPQ